MIYSADYLVTMDGPVIPDGALLVEDGIILDMGPRKSLCETYPHSQRHLEDSVLLPGLINCHAHLELSWARGLFPAKESFSMWVARLQKAAGELEMSEWENYTKLGVREALRFGTTSIVDVGNSGFPGKILPREIIRAFSFRECIGLDPEVGVDRYQQISPGILEAARSPKGLTQLGVCAHALYSCSLELLHRLKNDVEDLNIPWTFHLAESNEEWEFFTEAKGRLYEFCRRRYPQLEDIRQDPFRYAAKNDLISPHSLMVHCNYIDELNAREFAENHVSIAHCPRSAEFFGHREFPFELCHNAGVNVCFGTDSLASNESLSLFEEMACFKRHFPQVECEKILEMATKGGGKALGLEDKIGKLKSSYRADVIGINLKHDPAFDIYDEIVCEEHEVNMVLVDGHEVIV